MPIVTLPPDIDPTLSPIARRFFTDAEGRAFDLDPGEEARPDEGLASKNVSEAQEGQP